MKNPSKIKVNGSIYLSESIAPNTNGEKRKYRGEVYVKETLPAEYVMLEGVVYRRGMRLSDHNRQVLSEASNGKNPPKKIKLKGSDIVLEAVDSEKKAEYFVTKNGDQSKKAGPFASHKEATDYIKDRSQSERTFDKFQISTKGA